MFAVIEDCDVTRTMLSTIIESTTSKKVIGFASAEGFIREQKVNKHQLYAIFLDINLPGVSGLEFIQVIHKVDGLSETPVIICSATQKRENIITALKAGAANFIAKPFSKEQIHKVLASIDIPEDEASPAAVGDVPPSVASDDSNLLNEATKNLIDSQ